MVATKIQKRFSRLTSRYGELFQINNVNYYRGFFQVAPNYRVYTYFSYAEQQGLILPVYDLFVPYNNPIALADYVIRENRTLMVQKVYTVSFGGTPIYKHALMA